MINPHLSILLLASLTVPTIAQDENSSLPDSPALPRQVSSLDAMVPEAWEILAQASGDLNDDKQDDAVVILAHSNPELENPQYQRILVVLLAKGDGFEVSAVNQTSVLDRFSGGVLGDPFEKLTIERGTFVISHYAGSRDRWGYKHRYRFQDGGWFLIGRTTLNHDTLSEESHEKDENLITGRIIEKNVDADGRKSESDKRVKPVPLIPLGAGKRDEHGYLELP